jgi:hypothetical protein
MGDDMNTHKKNDISVFLWLLLPILFMVAQIFIETLVPVRYLGAVHNEGGPHEAFEALIAAICIPLAFRLFLTVETKLLRFWFLAATLGTIYICGEELSWGQHVFGWMTPEFWSGLNDQSETNLHNTSSWLDQKPRLLLFIGTIVAGLVAPALRRWKPGWMESHLPPHLMQLFPSSALIPTSLGVLLPYLADKIANSFGVHLFHRVSEVQEIYLFYFILLYLLDFPKRR